MQTTLSHYIFEKKRSRKAETEQERNTKKKKEKIHAIHLWLRVKRANVFNHQFFSDTLIENCLSKQLGDDKSYIAKGIVKIVFFLCKDVLVGVYLKHA